MSIFTGIATGFLGAAIKDKEAKDNLRMKIAESAGIDYYTKDKPAHEKKQKLFEKDFKMVELKYGTKVANLFGDQGGFYGDGNGLKHVDSILAKKNISKEDLKNFKFSTFEERQATRESEFQSKADQIKNLTGIGGIGPKAAELSLEGFGKTETTDVAPSETTDVAQATDTEQKVSTDISSLFTDKPEAVGVETKYNSISRAVNEQMGYGEPIYRADGSVTFNIANDLKTTSNAHIALASSITQQRDDINQLDAVSLAEQELFKQTVTPFNIIASSIEGANYSAGSGKKPALIEGMGGQTIDAETTMIGDQSVYDFVTEIYNNELLKDAGRVNRHVFKKFIENLPMNITYNGEKLSDVLANAHELQYFRNY